MPLSRKVGIRATTHIAQSWRSVARTAAARAAGRTAAQGRCARRRTTSSRASRPGSPPAAAAAGRSVGRWRAVEDGGADGVDGAGRWFHGGEDDGLGVGGGEGGEGGGHALVGVQVRVQVRVRVRCAKAVPCGAASLRNRRARRP